MPSSLHFPLLFIVFLLVFVKLGAGSCSQRCGQVHVRFPFQLKDINSDHSGYPDSRFHLSCTEKHEAVIEFPAFADPVKFFVKHIDYQSQEIQVYDPENCLSRQFLKLNDSLISPFQFKSPTLANISFFHCSTMLSCPVLAIPSDSGIDEAEIVSCTKMRDLSVTWLPWELPFSSIDSLNWNNYMILGWMKPDCSMCEGEGKKCRLKNSSTQSEIECFACQDKIPISIILIASGASVGSLLLLLVIIALFCIKRYYKMKRQDQDMIEKFLKDYSALKPTRFSYSEIKRITSGFKDNLGEGAHGTVYKGRLSQEILVAVKILNNTDDNGDEFINEVGTMGKIHHVTVVRLLGFCAERYHRALVYDFFPNGSLQNFISAPDNKDIFLGWEKLQQVALGVAKGIEYLHQGCDQRILHFDINPNNVLLDDNYNPKIIDFGLAKLYPKNQSVVSMTATKGTLGYIAPEVFSREFGNVSYKADIYSYGMLLLEIVGGRKNIDTTDEKNFQVLYPEWIHTLVEGEDVHIHIEDKEDIQTAKKLAIVGLWCIQWHPVDRPSMKMVLQMLEGEVTKLKIPPSLFDPTASVSRSSIQAKPLELEVIHELE